MNNDRIISQTKKWLASVIVANDFCPFAKAELDNQSVRFCISAAVKHEENLTQLIDECIYLDRSATTETILLIFSNALMHFDVFLDYLSLAENLLNEQGYNGIYQLASFHPKYCFQGADENDPANYTNRSPYPMLHLLREASIERALKHYTDAEGIPERNIAVARKLGLEKMKILLEESQK